MAYLLQVDFPHDVIFGEDFSNAFVDLAKNISEESGLIWKIWTENEQTKEAGGIYLFDNEADAALQRMVAMIEPIMIVVLGIVIGFIVISIMQPIFTMYGSVG